MPKHPEYEIKCVSDLIAMLRAETSASETTWFRGHSDILWELEPSINRQGYTDVFGSGIRLYKKFVQNSVKLISNPPREEYEWLFFMQHYGIPTHLMDWSESPLIGLFFAVDDVSKHNVDGALYIMEPTVFNDQAGHTIIGQKDIFAFGIDDETDSYLLTKINATNKQAKQPPMAVIGSKNSARIQAQEGVFIAHHRDLKWMENNFNASNWGWRHRIPANAKANIFEELQYLMMDYFTVYPQLDNLARKIKESTK